MKSKARRKPASRLQRGGIGTSCHTEQISEEDKENLAQRARLTEELVALKELQKTEGWSNDRHQAILSLQKRIDGKEF